MADYDIPEADALEQSEPVVGEPAEAPSLGPDVPEADVLVQADPVAGAEAASVGASDPEAPEADALEQSTPATLGDNEDLGEG